MSKRRILVTSALPYANGPIHIGHLVEYIQTDIWVRFQKQQNNECYYVCADDAHGTPIMILSQKENIEPEQLIKKMQQEHINDFALFHIDFDNYHSTHSIENKELCEKMYEKLFSKGYIFRKKIKQLFDVEKQMFLPDRFIKGKCPSCLAPDQYGDNCENCGKTYNPIELINPYSVLSNTTPIVKEIEHSFFDLPKFSKKLTSWLKTNNVIEKEVFNKLNQWLEDGLVAWDITRDSPYFGFQIPNHLDQYFYVWLDAPVGYIASFMNLCKTAGNINFDDFWNPSTDTELYHFIGKDIIYFHALFWPAQLMGADYRLPTKIFTHGFLTVNGKKMSKSRGTFITAKKFSKHFNPELLRYYFASKLNSSIEDIDLNFEEFVQKINADLVGKIINIASRTFGFITNKFDNKLCAEKNFTTCKGYNLYKELLNESSNIAKLYESRDTSSVVRKIISLADKTNEYIDAERPWILAKSTTEKDALALHAVCSVSINLFRLIITYLYPILPITCSKAAKLLNEDKINWQASKFPLTTHKINHYEPILNRLELQTVEELIKDV